MRRAESSDASSAVAASARSLYDRVDSGVLDYWRLMAAPRFRMRTLLELLNRAEAGSIVDLGCGNGTLLAEIHAAHPGTRLCGVDLSAPQIAANRETFPAITWIVADLGEPFSISAGLRGSFEVVIASELIEHLDRPDNLLRNALALARPGGSLFLSTQSGPVRPTERYVGHRRHFSASDVSHLLAEAGWTSLRVWNEGWPFHDLSKWFANARPQATLRTFSGRSYGPGQRAICWLLRGLFRLNSRRAGAQLFAVATALSKSKDHR